MFSILMSKLQEILKNSRFYSRVLIDLSSMLKMLKNSRFYFFVILNLDVMFSILISKWQEMLKNSRFHSLVLVDLAVIVTEEGQVESIRRELHATPPALQLRHIFVRPIGNPIEDHPR